MTPARFIAGGFSAGFAPVAPGTAGSVVGVAIGVALLAWSSWLLAGGAVVAALGGTVCIRAATGMGWLGSAKGDHDDPGWIVVDEMAGQMIALLALPRPGWVGVGLAFALFRLFDIWKPGPVGWADRQGGAVGVMADDVLAGVAAGVLVYLAEVFIPPLRG
jgi:phosphatidylglycerophosphatase A